MCESERFPLTGDNKAQGGIGAFINAYSFEPLAHPSFTIVDYDEEWPRQFQAIKSDLESDLADANVSYSSIEHIGSTSVPGLGTKATTDPSTGVYREAVLDVCIVIPQDEFTKDKLAQFQEALLWGRRQGGYGYIGDGGVTDRWSFKVRGITPLRNLYVVAEGGIPLRSYLSLRRVLREDADLRREYEDTKRQLAKLHGPDVLTYCNKKKPVIRKIFLKDGWTIEDVIEAEEQAKRDWPLPSPADFLDAVFLDEIIPEHQ